MAHLSGLTLIAASALLLAACSATPSATTATVAATTSTALPGTTAPAGSAAPVSGVGVCEYLRGEIPTLKGIGSEVGAMANLTANLYSWYDKQGAVPVGSQIDEQVGRECPDVAAKVYRLAGIENFASL